MKTIFDRVVGALALVALSPLLLAVAVAVKLGFARARVLFRQKRYGFNNEAVEVYKFRSMYVDKLDFTATKQVTRDDPRVTRVGRFIRKTSVDEPAGNCSTSCSRATCPWWGPARTRSTPRPADRQDDDVVDGYFARPPA